MRDFIDWQDLTEATGVDKVRISQGAIAFQDTKGNIWKVLPNSWNFSPRHDPKAPTVSTTKKVGAKATMQKVELPAYTKLVKSVKIWVGDGSAATAKGIVTITAKSGNDQIVFGRYLNSANEPRALSNSDFSDKKFNRATAQGGKLTQLLADTFLVGSPTQNLVVKDVSVEHYVFKNMNALKSKIIESMKGSSISTIRHPVVVNETKKFLDSLQKTGTGKFDWEKIGSLMNDQDKKKFGIFLVSELGWPFLVMGAGKSIGGGFPGLRTIDFFAVPTDSTNASYDSCLKGTLTTGEKGMVYVSSKAKLKGGKAGARPSAVPMLRETAKKLADAKATPNNPFFATLIPYINNLIVSKSPAASIVMGYGIREIAKIDSGTIPNPVKFWNMICLLTGYESGHQISPKDKQKKIAAYPKEEVDLAKKGILAVQKKFASGVTLPGIKTKGVIDQNIAGSLQPKQWEKFAQYLPDALCKLIIQGLNHDSSDFKPPQLWQVTSDNTAFINDGVAHLEARNLGGGEFKYNFTPGKNPPHDPTRDTTWIGYDPL